MVSLNTASLFFVEMTRSDSSLARDSLSSTETCLLFYLERSRKYPEIDHFLNIIFYFFFNVNLFPYLAELSLTCHTQDPPSSSQHSGSLVAACKLSCNSVPWPGIEPRHPALGAWNLTHWTTREVPEQHPLPGLLQQCPNCSPCFALPRVQPIPSTVPERSCRHAGQMMFLLCSVSPSSPNVKAQIFSSPLSALHDLAPVSFWFHLLLNYIGVLTVFYTPGPLTPGPCIAIPFPGVLHQISSSSSPFHLQLSYSATSTFITLLVTLLFLFLAAPRDLPDLSFLSGDGACAPGSGSMEFWSLDCQGIPFLLYFLLRPQMLTRILDILLIDIVSFLSPPVE